MATSPPLHLDLTPTIGITFIGHVLSGVLYGVTCIQTFHYFRSSGNDLFLIKMVVLSLLILDTAHQALITFLVYHYVIANFANPLELLHNIWTIGAEIIVNAVIAFIVECFLVVRVWLLSSNNIAITGLCGTLTVAHLVMNLVYPIKTLAYTSIQQGSQALQPIGTAGLAVAVVTDLCISGTLCFYLQKARTPFAQTNDIITKLIGLTVTTGLLTTAVVIANLIALVVAPSDLYSIFFNFQLAKLYINALLTSLNARGTIRNTGRNKENGSIGNIHSTIQFGLRSIEPSTMGSRTIGQGTDSSRSVHVNVQHASDVEMQSTDGFKIRP